MPGTMLETLPRAGRGSTRRARGGGIAAAGAGLVLIAGLLALPAWAQAPAPAPAPAAAPSAPASAPMPGATQAAATPASGNAQLYFIAPTDGARLRGPFVVQFGLRGMGVTQAGSSAANAGHHHLLVDVKEAIGPGETIPADKQHLHYGGGQTEVRVDLPPGRHTLQLVLGDANHRLFAPPVMSRRIEVVVLPPGSRRRRGRA